jgi:hypothetical protein
MKQTAIQKAIEDINGYRSFGEQIDILFVCRLLEKVYLEMEKQQIIDAFGVGCHLESKRLIGYHDVAEQHYNETYGSNGSDETYSQTEISDEEIEKAADKYVSEDEFNRYLKCFEEGAKWYREQLKQRQ